MNHFRRPHPNHLPEAATWPEDIHSYAAQDNPSAATRVVQGIYRRVQSLGQFPDLGQKYRSEQEGDVRILLYGHYQVRDRKGALLGVLAFGVSGYGSEGVDARAAGPKLPVGQQRVLWQQGAPELNVRLTVRVLVIGLETATAYRILGIPKT